MKKSTFPIIGIIILLFGLILGSCNNKSTSERYKYQVSFSTIEYQRDSLNLSKVLNIMLNKNIKPFRPPAKYGKNTDIYIDSILYGPDKLRLVVLLITKLQDESYDGFFLFCKKDDIKSSIKVYDESSFGFINFQTYNDVKNALNEYCFRRRVTDHPWKNKEPKYNMDDIRFWSSREFIDITSDSSFVQLDK
ncbi:hypothetical protein [Pedobacter montanisoli]|uniref:Lipoprotein n=1 Tax=Pedobacter montanisoli TaxID=2923277 RepID=A0ABT0A018_9SPHI|nr:hypothetical protein [Pedobacter montanisoli]MCJ0743869.1 hypothetical protein [Pedobacter montanisoli]